MLKTDTNLFFLMHGDDVVAILEIDLVTGSIVNISDSFMEEANAIKGVRGEN